LPVLFCRRVAPRCAGKPGGDMQQQFSQGAGILICPGPPSRHRGVWASVIRMHDIRCLPGQDCLVSALCVTEDRPAFMPWLLWNHRKQDHHQRELIIVDSSREPLRGKVSDDVTVIRCAPGSTVAHKRNLALGAARGSVITWFDDDDWQHPRKLSLLAKALSGGAVLAGSRSGWFVDLRSDRVRPHATQRYVIFNSLGARRSAVAEVTFNERLVRASDTAWLTAVRRSVAPVATVMPHVLSAWLCHRHNLSNPASRYVFTRPMTELAGLIGQDDWGDTEAQLAELRARLQD
jgi:hypothetical protein